MYGQSSVRDTHVRPRLRGRRTIMLKRSSLVRRFRRPTNIQITLESERASDGGGLVSDITGGRRRQPEQAAFGRKPRRKSDGRRESACTETGRVDFEIPRATALR